MQQELRARLHDALALELNLRAYFREWQSQVKSSALRLAIERAVTSIGPEADGLASACNSWGCNRAWRPKARCWKCFASRTTCATRKRPGRRTCAGAISILALGDFKASLYRSTLALAEALGNPQIEATLREVLAHLERDQEYLREVFVALVTGAEKDGQARAA